MENSKIEWTTHTFNPWVGCTKVSPGCANCYAEADMDHRRAFARWGKGSPRRLKAESGWKEPFKWNRDANGSKEKPRVFCASLSDVFDQEVPVEWRDRLFDVIESTQNLNWMLLTKRSEVLPSYDTFPKNVWLGVSVENQETANKRIPDLLRAKAFTKFLSVEPMLEPIKFKTLAGIDLVIVGGESGPNKRPFEADWARGVRDQCKETRTPFFMKQMDKVREIPPDLMIREMPGRTPVQ